MPMYKIRVVIVLAVMLLLSAFSEVRGEIQNLGQRQDSSSVSQSSQAKYLLTVAQIKKLVDTGQCKAAGQAFNQLKSDFPEISRPDSNDFDLFTEAEILRCQGKFVKASRALSRLLDEFPPESRFYDAALDRQFRIATAFLAGAKKSVLGIFKIKGYAEGVRIMDGISYRVALDDPEGIGLKAAIAVAEGYEQRKMFDEAFYRWAEIKDQHQGKKVGKDALLAMARCKQAMYRGPDFDASDLVGRPFNPKSYHDSAKGCYDEFKLRHSTDTERFEIDRRLKEVDEKLALKQFKIGQYYQSRGNKLSANLYYTMVVDRWPNTDSAKMAEEMLVKNSVSPEKTK